MKILQLTYESLGSPFGFGGAGVRAYEIFKRLRERHDVTILSLLYPGARDGEIQGLRHIFVGKESTSRTRSVLSYTLHASRFVRREGNGFDVIIENFLPAIPYFSRFLTQSPVILQMQGIMGFHALKKFNLLYGLPMYVMEKIYPSLYDTYILVSNQNGYAARQSNLKNTSKSKTYAVIPNGIDRNLLLTKGDQEDDYILFLSRIDVYTKGLDILIEAFRSIAERFQKVKLVLAGYEFNSTAHLIQRLPASLRERIRYAGFVSGREKLDLLSRAKVFVLPSRHEAHPVSVLEALACGRAVLVSDIPELRYIRDRGLGMTFQSGSPQDLSEKLSFLLANSNVRHGLGQKGREFASRFLWDEIALQFERFLLEVSGTKKKERA